MIVYDGVWGSNITFLNTAITPENQLLAGIFLGNYGSVVQLRIELNDGKSTVFKENKGSNGISIYSIQEKYYILPKKPEIIPPMDYSYGLIACESVITGRKVNDTFYILDDPRSQESENHSRRLNLFYRYLLDTVKFPVFESWAGDLWNTFVSSGRIKNTTDETRSWGVKTKRGNGFTVWQIRLNEDLLTKEISYLVKIGKLKVGE